MTYSPQQLKEMDAGEIAQCSTRHIMSVVEGLIETALATQANFESAHQHINHLRSIVYPPKMADSAAWRMVPVKHLSAIQSLIDPAPVTVGEKTMVFVNPYAAEVLTAISNEVRAMLDAVPPSPPEAEG